MDGLKICSKGKNENESRIFVSGRIAKNIELSVDNAWLINEKNGETKYMRKLNLVVENTSNITRKEIMKKEKSDVIQIQNLD